MAPFIDTDMNRLITQYYDSDRGPQYLYDGGQENLVEELQAWISHRHMVSKSSESCASRSWR